MRAFKRPDSIFAKANQVQSVIVNIRQLCDELLDKRVHSIKELSIGRLEALQVHRSTLLKAREGQDLKLSEQKGLLLQQKEQIESKALPTYVRTC